MSEDFPNGWWVVWRPLDRRCNGKSFGRVVAFPTKQMCERWIAEAGATHRYRDLALPYPEEPKEWPAVNAPTP